MAVFASIRVKPVPSREANRVGVLGKVWASVLARTKRSALPRSIGMPGGRDPDRRLTPWRTQKVDSHFDSQAGELTATKETWTDGARPKTQFRRASWTLADGS